MEDREEHRDLDVVAAAARMLDESASGTEYMDVVAQPLRQALSGPDDPLVPLMWPFDYRTVRPDEPDYERWGPYGPKIETDQGMYPPPLFDVKPDDVEVWRELRGSVVDPRLRARLDDVLWLRGLDDAYQRALDAVDGYLGVAAAEPPGVRQVQALQRSSDICVRLRDADRLDKTTAQVVSAIGDSLSDEEPKPGVTFRLLEILLRVPAQSQPTELDSLVLKADSVFGADPWHHQTALEMQRQRASTPATRLETERAQVETWAEAGRSSEGVQRHSHLMRAVELARDFGLRDVADGLRRELQELELDELGLQEISTEIEIPIDELRRQADWVASAADWGECLDRLVSLGPLTGSHEANLKMVRRHAEEFVFQRLMPQQVIGPFNIPIHTAFSDDEKEELALGAWVGTGQ